MLIISINEISWPTKNLHFVVKLDNNKTTDLEAATMYKLKEGQSLNMRTGQGLKDRELVRPAGPSRWSFQLVHPASRHAKILILSGNLDLD